MSHHPALRLLAGAAVLFVGALACNDHALNPYEVAVTAGLQQRGPAWTRPVDVLFVIDDSHSMCEEQALLQRNFDQFVDILHRANADFRLAVVTTDMVHPAAVGSLRTRPGDFVQTGTCSAEIDVSHCPEALPRFLAVTDYDALASEAQAAAMQRDFGCMAMAGTGGSPVEMGLGALREALLRDRQLPTHERFVRDDALLAVVVVSDENDCSDGTRGGSFGPVYRQTLLDSDGATACELQRNIEDSCPWSHDDPGPVLEHEGQARTAHAWCIDGRRDVVTALAGALEPACPPGGCANALVPRREIYDALVELKGGDPSEIIFAAIINPDGGVRHDDAASVEDWCGVGQQGYRYDLIARMFGEQRSLVAPICELGTGAPLDFAAELELIAGIIRGEISGVCLEALPAECGDDGSGCDDATIEVTLHEAADGQSVELVEGDDFTVVRDEARCRAQTGVPYRIEFKQRVPRPDDAIEVRFARTIGRSVTH